MTHLPFRHGTGQSTKLISVRLQHHTIEFADNYNFVLGRFINSALATYVHDLQAEHNVTHDKYWLVASGSRFVAYQEDHRGSVQKMVRVRSDLLEYLHINKYQVNTAINLACDRWRDYFKEGRVAQYIVNKIKKPHHINHTVEQ